MHCSYAPSHYPAPRRPLHPYPGWHGVLSRGCLASSALTGTILHRQEQGSSLHACISSGQQGQAFQSCRLKQSRDQEDLPWKERTSQSFNAPLALGAAWEMGCTDSQRFPLHSISPPLLLEHALPFPPLLQARRWLHFGEDNAGSTKHSRWGGQTSPKRGQTPGGRQERLNYSYRHFHPRHMELFDGLIFLDKNKEQKW